MDFELPELLKALKINLIYLKKSDGEAFVSAELKSPLHIFHMISTVVEDRKDGRNLDGIGFKISTNFFVL